MILLLPVTLLAALIICAVRFRNVIRLIKYVNKIPGNPGLPILGNSLEVLKPHTDLFNWVVKDLAAIGPVVRVWILGQPQVIITRARDAEKLLRGTTHLKKSSSYRFLHNWLGHALLTSQGDRWRIYRKTLTPAFHFNILHEFIPLFNKHALTLIERLSQEPNATSQRGFDIFSYTSLYALDIICESSMGKTINAQKDLDSPYVKAVIRIMELITRRYFTPWLRPDFLFQFSATKREMDKHIKFTDDFADKVIAERRQYLKLRKLANDDGENENYTGSRRCMVFLDLLLAAEEEVPEYLTQRDIRGNVSAFTFAGYDTVTTSMSWTLFMLGTYTDIQDQVVEELVQVFGDSGRAPDMNDLSNLKLLERCIKESLRLYPSAAFFERSIEEDTTLNEFTIPAGCTATFNVFSLHRDPEFFPDPEKFDPDRFLPENCSGRNPYAYMPFSAGARNCIGQRFAILEEKAVLSTILRTFKVEAAHSRDEAKLKVGMILRPDNGLSLRMFERKSHPNLKVLHY